MFEPCMKLHGSPKFDSSVCLEAPFDSLPIRRRSRRQVSPTRILRYGTKRDCHHEASRKAHRGDLRLITTTAGTQLNVFLDDPKVFL